MKWIALVYGAGLGVAQFFLLKEIVRLALAQQQALPKRVIGLVCAKLAVYAAAALGAVYLFEEVLIWAGVGLGAGLVGFAVLWFARTLRRAGQPKPCDAPNIGKENS